MVPQAILLFTGRNARFADPPRNSYHHDTSYAVTNPEGHVASGRAELDILFHKNLAL
jgi:hypothetical protein